MNGRDMSLVARDGSDRAYKEALASLSITTEQTAANSRTEAAAAHMMDKRKIVLLVQPTESKLSRTYLDFDSIPQAIEGVCGLYEKKLKDLNPELYSIAYDVGDLYEFIDGMNEMSALVYDPSVNAYLPCDRQWVKHRSFQVLRKLAVPAPKQS